MKTLTVSMAAVALAAHLALAGPPCGTCGCEATVKRICRPVWETKKVKVVRWDCECEDICIPRPGNKKPGCDDACCAPADCHEPKCGRVRSIKKLVKKEVEKEV